MKILEEAYKNRSSKLNKVEKTKNLKNPLSAYEKIEQFAKDGYESIPAEDKGYFLKCFGIFDKAATPNQFMMRVRIPGGRLNYNQAQAIGGIAKEFGKDYMDLTTRAQIELRYLSIENIPEILKRLKSVDTTSFQTGVDNFRGIVADPFDEFGYDNILPSHNLLLKLQERFLYNKDWISALPRKFNTSISGSIANRCNVFGHDCCFVLAQKDGIYGYNMYLGGKVGKIAKDADIFLESDEDVLKAYEAITEIFKKYGFRDNRNRNRLFFLIESVGIENIAKAIREYAKIDFPTAGATLTRMHNQTADQGKTLLRDKTFAINTVVLAGIFTGSDMIEASSLSQKYGSGDLRVDIEQNLYLMGIKKDHIDALLKENLYKKYKNISSTYANNLIACAGEEHCQFGVIPNKPDAIEMAKYLEEKVPLPSDSKIRMYWSGCVKGCGLHDLGDIGFEGCKAKVNGVGEYGVHIHIGGKVGGHARIGNSILKGIPLRFSRYYVESLVLEYRRLKQKSESFEEFNTRVLAQYSKACIGFMMMLLAYIRKHNLDIDIGFKERVKTGQNENFEIFEIGRALYKAIVKEEPYDIYENFTPIKSIWGVKTINFKKENIEEKFAQMILKMIDQKNRAVVFSEISQFVEWCE